MNSVRYNLLYLLYLLLLLPAVSCKKDEVKKLRKELLLGSWLRSSDVFTPAYDANGDGIKEIDAFPLYANCNKDNIITFKTGGSGEFDQGPLSCSGNPQQKLSFTWSLY